MRNRCLSIVTSYVRASLCMILSGHATYDCSGQAMGLMGGCAGVVLLIALLVAAVSKARANT